MSEYMTQAEYELTFAEWCKYIKKHDEIVLDKYGDFAMESKTSGIKEKYVKLYHEQWIFLLHDFRLREKHYKISNALESIRRNGIECTLNNWQNGCITAKTKNGRILTYYATTGTIAGYRETTMKGLETFIDLCRR